MEVSVLVEGMTNIFGTKGLTYQATLGTPERKKKVPFSVSIAPGAEGLVRNEDLASKEDKTRSV